MTSYTVKRIHHHNPNCRWMLTFHTGHMAGRQGFSETRKSLIQWAAKLGYRTTTPQRSLK